MAPNIPDEKLTQLTDLIFHGQKIEAIKLYRELTNLGLKESKDAVDALEVQLRNESPSKFTVPPGGSKGCGGVAAVLCIVGIVVVFYVLRKLA